MAGEGAYVLGLEPANCRVAGRSAERAAGTLEHLDHGEEKEFLLEIGVVEGGHQLEQFRKGHSLL
jgi:hypothetical protein